MIRINTPELYLYEKNILKSSGHYIAKYGKKPVIVVSKSSLKALPSEFFDDLKKNGIDTGLVKEFSGFPSENQFEEYRKLVNEFAADSIIGIGGGRVIDTCKAAGNLANVPVITIPTIAATCACWATLTVQYDDEGGFVQMRYNSYSPKLVIVDPVVILSAPQRYLYAGVVDTFAKFYENRPLMEAHPENTTLEISFHAAELALINLKKSTKIAEKEAAAGVYGQAARDVLDAIFYLAGFAGSFKTEFGSYSFAHPFYHCSTRLANTRIKLHGEKVALGIVAQLFLEKKSKEEILEAVKLFDEYNCAFSLADMGIKEHLQEDLEFLKYDIPKAFPSALNGDSDVVQALLDTDNIVKEYKNGKNNGEV